MAGAAPVNPPTTVPPPPLDMGVRLRLSVMMFFQFAVWGAWYVALGNYLGSKEMHFSGTEIGGVYGTMALGAIVSTLIVGQLADRYIASEYMMAGFHLVGAGLLYAMSQIKDPTTFYWVSLGYALVYNPTLSLSNSIAFSNIPDSTRDFPSLRVLGTIGWIAAGMFGDYVLAMPSGPGAQLAEMMFGKSLGNGFVSSNQPLLLATGLSALLGVFSFFLPHTPPTGKPGDSLPFLRAVGLLRNPNFAVFFGVSFAITIALAFYFDLTGRFLPERGVSSVLATMSIGQWSEIGFMLALPYALFKLGMKTVLIVGMAAWSVRYLLFAFSVAPAPEAGIPMIVLLGVALHGVCFDFFLAAGFIYTDTKAPASIRGSAQALFSFLTYGVGMWIGFMIAGRVEDANIVAGVRDWKAIWMIPAIGAAVCLAIFVVLFRDTPGKVEEEPAAEDTAFGKPAAMPGKA